MRFAPGGTLNSQPHTRGAQEQLTVIEGVVIVRSGQASDTLAIGDTARYAADVTHSITAQDGPARAFLVVKNA